MGRRRDVAVTCDEYRYHSKQTGRDRVSLEIVPVTFRQAQAFIARHHRHHKPPRGMKFCLGIAAGDELVGVATVGRPVARAYDDGYTLEVNRTCTDGTPNANSMLYGASWRAAKALGYRRLITYTQEGETGASLRAAGWRRGRPSARRGPIGRSRASPCAISATLTVLGTSSGHYGRQCEYRYTIPKRKD
jgi:tRNA A37 N6-isopentenylltransferase MiaA